MARPTTNSLIYFNVDVKEDDNLKYIEALHGHLGYYVVHKLWKHIYGGPGGYYCEWGEINQRLFCKENNISIDQLKDIISTCFSEDIRLFNKEMFDRHKILTSSGVQKRWKKIVVEAGRKKCHILLDYDLISTAADILPPPETTPAVQLSGDKLAVNRGETTQSKVKESKVKESTVVGASENGQRSSAGPGVGAAIAAPAAPQKDLLKKESGTDAVPKKKKIAPGGRDLPADVQQVKDFVIEKMKGKWPPERISLTANKFFSHYQANGWVQNRGKPIVSWKAAASLWILNEVEAKFTNGNMGQIKQPVHSSGPSQTSQEKPKEQDLSPEQKQELSRGFLQDCYDDFRSGRVVTGSLLGLYYNQLISDGLLTLTPQEKEEIKKEAKGDLAESKNIAVTRYFTSLKEQGVSKVYGLVKT